MILQTINLFMSLLTSPATTRDNHRFFNKMERQFNRRTFLNMNYVQPKHALQQVNENTDRVQELIKQTMNGLLDNLKKIIDGAHNSRIDYYFVMSEMKNFDFFNEVASIFQNDLIHRNMRLTKQNSKMRQDLKKSHQELREIERSTPKKQKNINTKFNASKSLAENLYQKSKTLNEQQFVAMCNRVILGDKVIIKKVADGDSYRKFDEFKADKVEQKEMLKRVDAFLQNRNKVETSDLEEQLIALIIEFRRYNSEKGLAFQCQRPCCNVVQERIQVKSKASLIRKSLESRHEAQIYKNDRSQQYFNRYYRRNQFEMKKIFSIQKTKMEEMEKIQDEYRISSKMRRKINNSELIK